MRAEDRFKQPGMTEAEAFAVYWQHSSVLRPGSWMLYLMGAIVLAGREDRDRLREAYPSLVEGIEHAEADPAWLAAAEEKARACGWLS